MYTTPWMAEGTTPRMEEVESRQEQRPRVTQDDSMEGVGRVVSGTKTEQLPRKYECREGRDNAQGSARVALAMDGVSDGLGAIRPTSQANARPNIAACSLWWFCSGHLLGTVI